MIQVGIELNYIIIEEDRIREWVYMIMGRGEKNMTRLCIEANSKKRFH